MSRTPAKAKFFGAGDLAAFFGVDLKTIHNWADKGKIPFFRTPGKHLRFKPEDVKALLERCEFPVPPEVIAAQPESTNG